MNKQLKVTVTISDTEIHVSEPGKSGMSFDTGENGEDFILAMYDLREYLAERYEALND